MLMVSYLPFGSGSGGVNGPGVGGIPDGRRGRRRENTAGTESDAPRIRIPWCGRAVHARTEPTPTVWGNPP
ncbi:hypothetical protein GCM10025734_23230 [Kitasatospora paranensis]